MSWYWSRLSTLAFLAVLYASPLSSGDKGLWLTVTSMTVPRFGALPGGMPPEHSILLPNRDGTVLASAYVERGEPALGTGLLDAGTMAFGATWSTTSHSPTWNGPDTVCPASGSPRGPPA